MALQEHAVEHAAEGVAEKFNAGKTIIEHVSNSSLDHPLIHLPTIVGIDFSVTKHVLMLWIVAAHRVRRRHLGRPPLPEAGPARFRPGS